MKPEITKAGLVLGIVEMVVGFAYMICTIIFNSKIGAPNIFTFVGNVPLIVAGILGLIFGLKKHKGLLIAHMAVSIIVSIICIIGAVIFGLAVGAIDTCNSLSSGQCLEDRDVEVALMRCFVAFGVLGFLSTLASSIVGCMGTCCHRE